MATQYSHSTAPGRYDMQRDKLAAYFDGTARKAWIDLTSDAKVSGIRATVRAGREEMRATLLDWLPADLRRQRLLDAGCGTGALSMDAACRGAEITAIDVAGGLVDIARKRSDGFHGHGRIDWRVGDMLDPALGTFDHIVAMDSLIHYTPADMVEAVAGLAANCRSSLLFTFAPYTPLLGAMHRVGKLFPRSDRSPAIVPVSEADLRQMLASLSDWRIGRSHRVSSGFYTSQALELVRR
ncbi:magnesium protoporphyrin IX methyltransferase [Aurantiacibacter zhengii]|uniref:Magnesium protoporphyrin IX methyltransferase n=1 Tax=Aurantiacibacter zhengii TaxID=2307003 RepID=A0A418NRP3_9SPHN|nr:magnesium protoporphyrin IX methyltransferase [Aurantiacibacter zhengii]RIV85612.1 magnesium protoporphyrin IX methyltransferase [Aurantiacibacter zhengii]